MGMECKMFLQGNIKRSIDAQGGHFVCDTSQSHLTKIIQWLPPAKTNISYYGQISLNPYPLVDPFCHGLQESMG
jgi:hypothetical protein